MCPAPRFLVLDDDADMRFLHRLELSREFPGCEVIECGSADEALARCAERSFDAILTDNALLDGSGTQVIAELRQRGVSCPIMLVTGNGDPRVHEKACQAGASHVVSGTKLRFAAILRSLLPTAAKQG